MKTKLERKPVQDPRSVVIIVTCPDCKSEHFDSLYNTQMFESTGCPQCGSEFNYDKNWRHCSSDDVEVKTSMDTLKAEITGVVSSNEVRAVFIATTVVFDPTRGNHAVYLKAMKDEGWEQRISEKLPNGMLMMLFAKYNW